MSDEFQILLEFDTDDAEFSRGFEAGRVWSVLNDSIAPFDCTMHTANSEMVLRMAEASHRKAKSEPHGDEWMTVWFSLANLDKTEG